MKRMPHGDGFSMVELLVTLSILAILLTLAMPNFSTYLATSRLRGTADSIRTGLQLARASAIQQNATTSFWLDGSTGNWLVQLGVPTAKPDFCPLAATNTTYIQQSCGENAQGGPSFNQLLTVHALPTACPDSSSAPFSVNFGSDGRLTNPGLANPARTSVDLCTGSPPSSVRRLVINTGGSVRLCDPTKSAGDPAYCDS